MLSIFIPTKSVEFYRNCSRKLVRVNMTKIQFSFKYLLFYFVQDILQRSLEEYVYTATGEEPSPPYMDGYTVRSLFWYKSFCAARCETEQRPYGYQPLYPYQKSKSS